MKKEKAKSGNGTEFFTARKPQSTITGLEFNRSAAREVSHEWRYFVAAGESLDKINFFLQEASTYKDDIAALAKSVGAESVEYNRFAFKNAEVEPVPPSIRLRHKGPYILVSEITAPGDFFMEPTNGWFAELKTRIAAIEALPQAEQEAARAQIATDVKADSFDGKFFHFNDWQSNVEAKPDSGEKKFRLKSNPIFVRGPYESDSFTIDLEKDEGYKLQQKVQELANHTAPSWRFTEWVESFEVKPENRYDTRDRKHTEVEKIGDEWIIKVPVITEGFFGADGKGGVRNGDKESWVQPPGATPLPVSEYFRKVEQTGSLRTVASTAPKLN